MNAQPVQIGDGIVLFEGKISRNLMFEPMVSHTYLLEDGEQVLLFDPSCGKEIAKRVEAYIYGRQEAGAEWKEAVLIAGHSHMDHANNFYLSDVIGAEETHVYLHENGFWDGRVLNEPLTAIKGVVAQTMPYYNYYLSFFAPYNLLMLPIAALHTLSPSLAQGVFGWIGALPWPRPVNGSTQPEPLREADMQAIDLGGVQAKGQRVNGKVILATPGHSPCSVSLFWPEKKALFVSDADWVGNPVFMNSSLRDCLSSLEMMKALTEAGQVDLLLPAHGTVVEDGASVLNHLDFRIQRLKAMRDEVLSAYRSCGEDTDVRRLTKMLVRRSPLFRTFRHVNYPTFVLLAHNVVAICLREEGILP